MEDPPRIDELSAASIRGVALRLKRSSGFADLVYRESEMDALFTLADIAISTARSASSDPADVQLHRNQIGKVRDLVFEAHDCTHDDALDRAATLLEHAAVLMDGMERNSQP